MASTPWRQYCRSKSYTGIHCLCHLTLGSASSISRMDESYHNVYPLIIGKLGLGILSKYRKNQYFELYTDFWYLGIGNQICYFWVLIKRCEIGKFGIDDKSQYFEPSLITT